MSLPRLSRRCLLAPLAALSLAPLACTGTDDDDSANAPPVVTPLPDVLLATASTVTITAVASDPDGDALSYAWEQLPGATLANLTGANTAAVTVQGTSVKEDLSLRVTVTDPAGQAATADVKVLVRHPTNAVPLPLAVGRQFAYKVREQVYTWTPATSADAAYLRADNPTVAGDLVVAVTGQDTINGVPLWTLDIQDSTTDAGGACDPAGNAVEQCGGNPNQACSATSQTCVRSKGFTQQVQVIQVDSQLRQWSGTPVDGLLIVDATRPDPPAGAAYLYDGYELLSAKTRVAPAPPESQMRFLGQKTVSIPGTAPAGSQATGTAALVEVFDGVRAAQTAKTYRLTRAYYASGKGLLFFQWEDIPRGFESSGAIGYRDAVLVSVTPVP